MQKVAVLLILLMFLRISKQQCLAGFRQSPSGLCAKVNSLALDVFSAEHVCAALSDGGHLVSIHSAFDNQFLRAYAEEVLPGTASAYIGLIDVAQNGNFSWFDGTTLNYVNWCAGYPSLINANDNCVVMNVAINNCWENTNCGCHFTSICEQGDSGLFNPNMTCSNNSTLTSQGCPDQWYRYQGFCYRYFYETPDTWPTAEAYCITQGAHLASIHSFSENQFVLATMTTIWRNFGTWIGLQGNSNIWADGTAVDFTNYYESGSECRYMYPCDSVIPGKWDSTPCGDSANALCKKPANTI